MNEASNEQRLGIVVSGSLDKGLEVRLDSSTSIEDMAVGRYVTIEGQKQRFLGMISDVSLGVTDQRLISSPPDATDPFITEVLAGTSTYGTLHVSPQLTISGDVAGATPEPKPVKTIPGHFSMVKLTSDRDMELVFGKEDKQRFWIGNPLDMETKLCLNLPEMVKRSNGIFGKSGTGKTFLTRMLLIGMLQKGACVNLVFDMHSEYGWQGSNEKGPPVKALKQLFQSRVALFTLDEKSARYQKARPDFAVRVGYDEIEPQDMALLRQTLNLTEQAIEAVYLLRRKLGKSWLEKLLRDEDPEEMSQFFKDNSIHESTVQNLRRGLNIIRRLPFIEPRVEVPAFSAILGYLDRGINVVLEFGRYKDITAYILVANLLSRRIYAHYQEKTERAMSGDGTPPIPLVITIEEAHKFLSPEVAPQTIFGTIAREMRKYNATLLVIDQRPSSIDSEVMSQLGTKITHLLDNERDVDSVLSGTPGKGALKSVLARLGAKQQALIFGHAVPMPVAFEPREYGSAKSYKSFFENETATPATEQDMEQLWQ